MIALRDFLAAIETRKRALGILDDPNATEAMRNMGLQRTPEKRVLLGRAAARASAQGFVPGVKSQA